MLGASSRRLLNGVWNLESPILANIQRHLVGLERKVLEMGDDREDRRQTDGSHRPQ